MKYVDRLSHPKWQRRRLEIMSLHNFACQSCRAEDQELHIHHKRYIDGREPWEYDDADLSCLCHRCHQAQHLPEEDDRIDALLKSLDRLKQRQDDRAKLKFFKLHLHLMLSLLDVDDKFEGPQVEIVQCLDDLRKRGAFHG